jgi:tetratricopeptide (TPR) repeat protein
MDRRPAYPPAAQPPPDAPPPWPPIAPPLAPHDIAAGGTGSPRRWPLVVLTIAGVLTSALGVAAGAAGADAAAASTAAHLEASGDFARAVSLDEVLEGRTGLIFVLDPSAASTASTTEERTLLAWAKALGRSGKIDAAVALYRTLTSGSVRAQASDGIAVLLYTSATRDAAQGAYSSAILRLQQLVALAPRTADGRLAQRQLPLDQVGEARQLLAAGKGADAVAALAAVIASGSAAAIVSANLLYPVALLVAGQEEVAQQSYKEAIGTLHHLVMAFPGTAQAAQAQAMLSAPVPVSGTLVGRNGAPVPAPVRLSTNYKSLPGGTYRTSGPFYYATANASGDFTFPKVPVGGPYILEVFTGGNWTTLVDPTSGQPAHPVKVGELVPVDLTFVVLPS